MGRVGVTAAISAMTTSIQGPIMRVVVVAMTTSFSMTVVHKDGKQANDGNTGPKVGLHEFDAVEDWRQCVHLDKHQVEDEEANDDGEGSQQ